MMLWSVFPAYAGMIRLALVDAFLAVVFPHTRDDPDQAQADYSTAECSPHTRDDPSTSHTLGTSGSCSPHTRG